MLLPTTTIAAVPASTAPWQSSSGDAVFWDTSKYSHKPTDDWSSLIGIVTAIIGNVLISFALNTQRYAHIVLEKDRVAKLRRRKLGSDRDVEIGRTTEQDDSTNGSTKSSPDQKRKRGNVYRDSSPTSGEEVGETAPLLSSRNSSASEESRSIISTKERRNSEGAPVSYLRSPYWWTGIVLMTVGEAGNFLAYGFAPASIVSPLGVVALISNCIIAPFMLKERFRKRDLLGVLVAIAGAVTVVLSASSSNPKLGPGEIWGLINRWEFETYLGITVAFIIGLMIASNKYGHKTVLIDLGLVGLFGGYTALSTKGVASLLSYTLYRALTFPVTYLLVIILVGTAVMQIKYLNRALQRFDATQVIPIQFVMFTLSVILGSAVLYRDFEQTSGEDAGKFVGGCALTFLGVWLITSGRKRDDEDEVDRSPEEDDAINLVNEERYQDEVPSARKSVPPSRRQSTFAPTSYQSNTSRSGRRPSHQVDVHEPFPGTPAPTRHEPPETPTIQLTPHDDPGQSPFGDPSPLAENPWAAPTPEAPRTLSSNDVPTMNPPALKTTASAPILPANAHSPLKSRPETPRDPLAPSSDTHLTPTTPGGTEDRSFRNSISGIIPGPLSSPLSSALSAVVADSLRRGVDPPGAKRRRAVARQRLPNMPSRNGLGPRGASDADLNAAALANSSSGSLEVEADTDGSGFPSPSPARIENAPAATEDPVSPSRQGSTKSSKHRRRSLSNTLGDFLKGKRRKTDKGAASAAGADGDGDGDGDDG
ncbi:DUF803-domain-containing protein [Aulographum hederae CBS 113979]|uniref:DUF803-domain-containing protein n=1 Tax=Aulographum hederae CBS 113979 TaxID=1176131 RepID=A0A6G1GLK4_9PEZI|nr:DUF803-domain-containing protein [Aulographum hederae CBS 113979]